MEKLSRAEYFLTSRFYSEFRYINRIMNWLLMLFCYKKSKCRECFFCYESTESAAFILNEIRIVEVCLSYIFLPLLK